MLGHGRVRLLLLVHEPIMERAFESADHDTEYLPMSSAMQSNPEPSLASHEPSPPVVSAAEHVCGIPPMVAKSQEAFRRDLPQLLNERYRWWVAYHGDERIGFGKTETELYKECFRRGLTEDEFVVRSIQPDAADEIMEVAISPWV